MSNDCVGWRNSPAQDGRGFGVTDGKAFLYSQGVMTDIGTLGGTFSEGLGINDAGQVTGTSYTSDHVQHAFLYSNGTVIDLNTVLDPVTGSGWNLQDAWDINDAGQIVANGFKDGIGGRASC